MNKEVTFSPYQLDFLAYRKSKLDILEGASGSGKSAVAFPKFILETMESKYKFHIIACKNVQKTEQNLINNPTTGLCMFAPYATYYPRGKGQTTTSHILVNGIDGEDKIIYLITYSDAGKWEEIRGGDYGCSFIDEVNLVPSNDPEEIPRFITELKPRTREHGIWTLNPDEPDKPIYKIINQARPLKKYKNKGPKEIRKMLDEPENPDYKWWFFERSDNPTMTPEEEKERYESLKGTKQFNSLYLGLRAKSELLAFPSFNEENFITEDEIFEGVKNGKIKWKNFCVGLDTSYSGHTNDLIALMFVGITFDKKVYVLDEFTFNNSSVKETDRIFAPDLAIIFYDFLHKNSKRWGYPEYCFVDEADSDTIGVLRRYSDTNHEPFMIRPSKKHAWSRQQRMAKIDELTAQNRYLVVKEKCPINVRELDNMTVDLRDKTVPVDKDNHTYDALCYAIESEVLKGGI